MWSTGRATEGEVSDVYVRLGYEFNIACRAFNAINVETTDLGPVPDMLRTILEETLSQEASQQSLEKYLPRIRDIIINLLHGLKKKQQRLRQKGGPTAKEGEPSRPPRHASTASTISAESNQPDGSDLPARQSSSRSFAQRQGSGEVSGAPDYVPPRTTSAVSRVSPQRKTLSPQNSLGAPPPEPHDLPGSESASSLSSTTLQDAPVIAPYPEADTIPAGQPLYDPYAVGPPPAEPSPQPRPNDALTALQRGGDLERRASRRFSAYVIQKSLGTSMNGISAIPPAQNSPVPNRGRDARESIKAVRSRMSVLRARSRTERSVGADASPSRDHEVRRISEEPSAQRLPREDESAASAPEALAGEVEPVDSPTVKTPEDKLASSPFSAPETVSATLNGPLGDVYVPTGPTTPLDGEEILPTTNLSRQSMRNRAVRQAKDFTPPVMMNQYLPESPPRSGKELTLFLQYKSKVKKFVFPDGSDLTIPRLQLAFIEKFAWNTHNNGVDLPEIYIQDPISGIRHELEDLSDIKERSVLVLNVEALDEVKRHFDEGIGSLRRIVEGIRTSVTEQQSSLQLVSERQQETAKELASIAAAPPPAPVAYTAAAGGGSASSTRGALTQIKEVQTLRRDLAVVRQTYTSFAADIAASMATIRTKAGTIKKAVADAKIPDMDSSTGRAYVDAGKKTLHADSERIVNRVDDLQDLVEDLRKDVVTRGVRPLPRQLETVSKDISAATAELKKLQEFLRREKPTWTKIWEKELQVVCDDRDLLTMQEELAADLEDDLEKAAATFALVEQATKQQSLHAAAPDDLPNGTTATTHFGPRLPSRTLAAIADPDADPVKAKDSVLGEVRALSINHESRLEAIARAEKARQRELESRGGGEFKRELGRFVQQGKLKKSGGVEEVERIRKIREEKTRKEVWERTQARLAAQAEKQAAAAAAAQQQAAAAAAAGQAGVPEDAAAAGEVPIATTNHELAVPPNDDLARESSPEPDFVEAKEIASPTNGENHAL